MTKKTGLQLYRNIKAGPIFLGTQASDQVGFLSLMISSRPSKELNIKLENFTLTLIAIGCLLTLSVSYGFNASRKYLGRFNQTR